MVDLYEYEKIKYIFNIQSSDAHDIISRDTPSGKRHADMGRLIKSVLYKFNLTLYIQYICIHICRYICILLIIYVYIYI